MNAHDALMVQPYSADERLLRELLAIPANFPIIRALNAVLGGALDDPELAVWRAVDADAIRRLGLVEGAIDSGLYQDWTLEQYERLVELLGDVAAAPPTEEEAP